MPALEKKTVRELMIEALVETIRGLDDDADGKLFNNVERGDISLMDIEYLPAAALEESEEVRMPLTCNHEEKDLRLLLTFRFPAEDGVDGRELFNYYLGRLQQALFKVDANPKPHGGFAYLIQELGSIPEGIGDDPAPGGTLMFHVQYRHETGNPYSSE